jgi:hypothetical protein
MAGVWRRSRGVVARPTSFEIAAFTGGFLVTPNSHLAASALPWPSNSVSAATVNPLPHPNYRRQRGCPGYQEAKPSEIVTVRRIPLF